MDWVPIVFLIFKLGALAIAMFFAIKWHYDQGEKGNIRAMIRTGGMFSAAFLILLLAVVVIGFTASRMLGLDLNL